MQKKVENIDCLQCGTRSKSVFCDLYSGELEEINAAKDTGFFKKGQLIFSEGSRPRGLFCVNSGKVKVYKMGDEGKDQILHLAKPGDILGYRAILSGDLYSCSASAIEDSSVCFIPQSLFRTMVEKNVSLSLQIIKLLSTELKSAEKHITDIAQKPVRERVAEVLLLLKETFGMEADGKTINATLTREEIANIAGTATESCIRILSELKSDKIIDLKGKNIILLNLPLLVKTANVYD
jgi:CRP/FNR family transcriptional regulator, polysaccharide utilization system transcription regulator